MSDKIAGFVEKLFNCGFSLHTTCYTFYGQLIYGSASSEGCFVTLPSTLDYFYNVLLPFMACFEGVLLASITF